MAIKDFPLVFTVGDPDKRQVDFDARDIERWTDQIAFWVKQSQPRETDPPAKAQKIMKAALNGTKLSGEIWPGLTSFDLRARLRQFCGWDIQTGTGRSAVVDRQKEIKAASHPRSMEAKARRGANEQHFENLDASEMVQDIELYKALLQDQFPWLDNPVYTPKVQALAESEVRLKSLSDAFMTASEKPLIHILEVRELLRKEINELMKLLSIHPEQLLKRVDDTERGDVGSLIVKLESMGKIWQEYEMVDAIQELIMMVHQTHNLRVDGSPQLADYLLWHKTGCAGHHYKCECGREVELYRGFTRADLEQAAEQAFEAFGYGLKRKQPKHETTEIA